MDRKGMKANARKAYKRHYWMIVVICLFASVFGVAYSSSTWSVNASSPSATVQEDGTAQSDNVSKVLENLLVGDESQARRQVEHNQEQCRFPCFYQSDHGTCRLKSKMESP